MTALLGENIKVFFAVFVCADRRFRCVFGKSCHNFIAKILKKKNLLRVLDLVNNGPQPSTLDTLIGVELQAILLVSSHAWQKNRTNCLRCVYVPARGSARGLDAFNIQH